MTHEYTILTGGVIAGDAAAGSTAIAWAAGTVLALGDDGGVRAISRGDSHHVDLLGAVVRPLGGVRLEVGGPADFEILERLGTAPVAVVRGGHVVEGGFPGLESRRDSP